MSTLQGIQKRFVPVFQLIAAVLTVIRGVVNLVFDPVRRLFAFLGAKLKTVVYRILGAKPDEELIWALVDYWRSPIKQVVGLVLFMAAFIFIFRFSPLYSFVFLVSMYLHEAGHAVFFIWSRIKIVLLLLFPLGAVAAPINKEENKRSDELPWWNIAWILQGGPLVNILLILVASATLAWLSPTDPLVRRILMDVVEANKWLAIFNLIPVWKLDAGQLFKVIFSSTRERIDVLIAVFATVACGAVMGLTLGAQGVDFWQKIALQAIYNAGPLLVLFVITVSIWHSQGKDKPEHSSSALAMTLPEVLIHLSVYAAQILVLVLTVS